MFTKNGLHLVYFVCIVRFVLIVMAQPVRGR